MLSASFVYEHVLAERPLYHTLYALGCVCKRQLVVQGDQVQRTHMLTHTYTHMPGACLAGSNNPTTPSNPLGKGVILCHSANAAKVV